MSPASFVNVRSFSFSLSFFLPSFVYIFPSSGSLSGSNNNLPATLLLPCPPPPPSPQHTHTHLPPRIRCPFSSCFIFGDSIYTLPVHSVSVIVCLLQQLLGDGLLLSSSILSQFWQCQRVLTVSVSPFWQCQGVLAVCLRQFWQCQWFSSCGWLFSINSFISYEEGLIFYENYCDIYLHDIHDGYRLRILKLHRHIIILHWCISTVITDTSYFTIIYTRNPHFNLAKTKNKNKK